MNNGYTFLVEMKDRPKAVFLAQKTVTMGFSDFITSVAIYYRPLVVFLVRKSSIYVRLEHKYYL